MATNSNTHVVVQEQPRRRRFAGVLGTLALGVAMVAGATTAAFTDSEYANMFKDGEDGIKTGTYNIQIRAKGAPTWSDTTLEPANAPDNRPEDTEDPVELTLSQVPLVPGETTGPETAFEVRNENNRTHNTSLNLRLKDITVSDSQTDAARADLLAGLRFDVTVKNLSAQPNTEVEHKARTWTQMTSSPIEIAANAAPGVEFEVTIKVTLVTQGAATDGKIQGVPVKLLAQVDGESL
ncbi:MAG: SipW-dependent-type signal peptide-containing protein [Bifidobacteriaceae bacterium]|jgi:predicted ribosomally synthesized peptide with SipW-like signal peptide|nr:SipW-dependent-type signal peptide-containing protein [Bifidobacteriaceae bacterium]